MADADEDGVAIPGARVRFGAIGGPDRAALVEGMVKGNIHIAGGAVGDRFALSDGSEQTRERQEELMRELESRRRQRAIAVTTDDGEVRAQLRQHGEPVTLFGEGPGDRRDRLRRILAKLDAADGGALPVPEDAGVVPESQAVAQKEVFYTEGTAELAAARLAIAAFSMPRAEARLRRLRAAREGASGPDPERDPEGASVALASLDLDARRAAFLETEASVVGDDRPLCDVRFSKPDGGALILSASWTGAVKLWSAARCE
jgi:U4/U6 small nuclear ribonucleoprotein PRP4